MQAKTIRKELLANGKIKSLANNLRASANGTNNPKAEGLLGPWRNIIYPKTLRSIKVKNATAINKSKSERSETNMLDLNSILGKGWP